MRRAGVGLELFSRGAEPSTRLERRAAQRLERALAASSETHGTITAGFCMAARHGRVIVEFDPAIEWLDFTAEEAERFAEALLAAAGQSRDPVEKGDAP